MPNPLAIVLGVGCVCLSSLSFAATPIEERSTAPAQAELFDLHRATTTSGAALDAQQFDDAQVCGACHTEIYKEWRSSIMAHAWDDPIYRALLSRASKATNGQLDAFCTGCHTPIGLITQQVTTADNQQPPDLHSPVTELPGVDCEACHNISGITGLDNGAYVVHAQTAQKTKFGPRPDAQSPYHQTAYSDLHMNSDFCAACHNVTHPVNNVPIERTFDEWYESPYRQAGVHCQDCHMPPTTGKAAVMGPVRQNRASHRFAGANTTILEHFGHTENAAAARRLLATSATLEWVDLPSAVTPGTTFNLGIKVTNSGAGHKLPTGFPEGREVWLDLKVTDADGKQVYRLGAIKDGKTEPGTKNFMVHMGDKDGNKVEVEVWRVTHIMSDNRILPKGHAIVDYQVALPKAVKGPLTIDAQLKYWPFSQAFADELLGKGKLPVKVETITRIKHVMELQRTDQLPL